MRETRTSGSVGALGRKPQGYPAIHDVPGPGPSEGARLARTGESRPCAEVEESRLDSRSHRR